MVLSTYSQERWRRKPQNNWRQDDKEAREIRDAILVPGFYKKYAFQGRYVLIDKGRLVTLFQRRYAVDTVVQKEENEAICIEEKIVRWPGYQYDSFVFETKSCTVPGYQSVGWMVYGLADYLLYCFRNEDDTALDCWLINFPKLKTWFWQHEPSFPTFQMKNTLNKSAGRKVKIALVEQNVPCWRKIIQRPEERYDAPGI